MKEKVSFVGVVCDKCMNGITKNMAEGLLEDGIVILRSKCNACGHIEKMENKSRQSSRFTGITKCQKCGYEYFYTTVSTFENLKERFDEIKLYSLCPNCNILGYQSRLWGSYGPLKHEHGNLKSHPITQKHRKIK